MSSETAAALALDPVELYLLIGLAAVMGVALLRRAWQRRRAHRDEIDPFRVFRPGVLRRAGEAPTAGPSLHGLAWAPPASEMDDEEEAPYIPSTRPVVPPAPIRPATPPAAAPRPAAIRPTSFPYPHPAAGLSSMPQQRRDPFAAPPQRPAWNAVPAPRPDDVDEASQTIRLPTASDGTVQILPGALVMTEGPEVGKEYRFLRIGSQDVPEITLGRVAGPPYRHIQLAAATVSRMHARIRYLDGSWRIANLSDTNPVRLNGRELRANDEIPLVDGDRLQLGEVELSYQDRRL